MRYVMKQRLFSWGDFVIKDESNCDRFFAKRTPLDMITSFSFRDLDGKELASIGKETPWTYDICKEGTIWAVVHKKMFSLLSCKFTVTVPEQDDLLAQGDFSNHEYVFTRAGNPIAHVSRRWFTSANTYGVDVDQQNDDILILASTVVIDACTEKARVTVSF